MTWFLACAVGFAALLPWSLTGEAVPNDGQQIQLPSPGFSELKVLAPTLLELTLVTTKRPDPAPVEQWNFVDNGRPTQLPGPDQFEVRADSRLIHVQKVGFKRRVLYAPFKKRDLRIANYLYLALGDRVSEGEVVEVRNQNGKLWPPGQRFAIRVDTDRWSPAIHVNESGYLPTHSKEAMIGWYLGSLGEMDIPRALGNINGNSGISFQIIEANSGKAVFHGELTPRKDLGFPFPCYESVLEADFSAFTVPGEYRLRVPGLGASFAFFIDDGVAASWARTYALGLYHQRCGMANELPFTRFVHGPCHTAPAQVPDESWKFRAVREALEKETADYKGNPRHTAPQLKTVSASLYPFANHGPVDVRGGHHDAGDYSKYTINSAAFIHCLVFAADVFPGAVSLDNLGIPESGDGKSDLLQEAKWEADFLAKMQDADGGFYFLVYPRDREYEIDVLPDHGDPQVLFPKTTAATAAATAALAQCSSSPAFKAQFPEAAARYLQHAEKGWKFLSEAITKFGKDGAYQKITHYGDDFMHDDELAWAACELFLATGNESYETNLMQWLDPSDASKREWGWWRLYASYGNAIRSYAFAARTGRLSHGKLHPLFLEQCENEIAAAGEDQLKRAQQSAYGTSFPKETKQACTAGWYFSSDAAFDLAVACQLDYPSKNDPRPKMLAALLSNLNYEQGCNPVNIDYLTGLGWRRQREIVDQFAQNDRRVLPPDGIPLGNIQAGFGWLEFYKKELGELSFPPDDASAGAYPFYDRWGDSFNLSQEFVIVNQARALGYLAWLMAQTPLRTQSWKSVAAHIDLTSTGSSSPNKLTAALSAPGLSLEKARIIWEADGQEPSFGSSLILPKGRSTPKWLEAEAQLPDGRRIFAATNFATNLK